MAQACAREVEDDHFVALAVCANSRDAGEESRCIEGAEQKLLSAQGECRAQDEARAMLCGAVGQMPYDPVIRPADFVGRVTNPYFPLKPGTKYVYRKS